MSNSINCGSCYSQIEGTITKCPECNIPYHEDCWKKNNSKCSQYGCKGKTILASNIENTEEAAKLLEAQSQLMENQRVADIRRERQFAEYSSTVEQLRARADEIATQTTGFIQMREDVRRVLNEFPEFERRMEARVNEIFEIQRDAEERAKRQSEGFKDRIEKDWQDFATAQNEKWFERDRRISEYDGRFEEVEDELARVPSLQPVYEILEAFAKNNAAAAREWLAQMNTMLDKAKTTSTSDVRLSRRQRRKHAAIKADESGKPTPV